MALSHRLKWQCIWVLEPVSSMYQRMMVWLIALSANWPWVGTRLRGVALFQAVEAKAFFTHFGDAVIEG